MGTNYYAVQKKPAVHSREIHLGKSSYGWKFLFHETDEIKTFPQFVKWLDDNITKSGEYVLMNEYNEVVTVEKLLELIKEKQDVENPDNFKHCRNIDGYRFSNDEFC